jgi:TonB family protein
VEGRVSVTVDLDERGRVVEVRLFHSSGDRAIDQAVLETVQERWRFENIDGGANNVPVEVYMTVDGSELNQQAQEWGNQTVVEIPSAGFAAPEPLEPAAFSPEPPAVDPTPANPTLEAETSEAAETLPNAVTPLSEPVAPTAPATSDPSVASESEPLVETPSDRMPLEPQPPAATEWAEPTLLETEFESTPAEVISEEITPIETAPIEPTPVEVSPLREIPVESEPVPVEN